MILTALSAVTNVLFWLYALIVFIVVLGVIILIHEGGHFFFAKKANMLVHEFSIGMGPVIAHKKKGETTYSIRAIPVGGFCAIAGEDNNEELLKKDAIIKLNFKKTNSKELYLEGSEETLVDEELEVVSEIITDEKLDGSVVGKVVSYDLYSRDGKAMYIELEVAGEIKKYYVARDAFYVFSAKERMQLSPYDRCSESKTKWQQFLTIFAGPFMNFVLAFFIFIIVGLASGVPNTNSTVIGEVTSYYPASEKLQAGDKILSVNGDKVNTWIEFSTYLSEHNGEEQFTLVVERDGQEITETISTVIISYRLGVANFDSVNNKLYTPVAKGLQVGMVFSDDYVVGKAGIKNGDILLAYYDHNDLLHELSSWKQLIDYLDSDSNMSSLKLQYSHDGEVKEVVTSVWTERSLKELNVASASKTAIGVSCKSHFSFFGGLKNACLLFWNSISTVFMTLAALFSNKQITINDLSGPVGIFQAVKTYLGTDIITFLSFVGLISANIGLVNLLPIPALDGGRILFIVIEAITGKKINKKVENTLNNIVFILVMILFFYITVKDIIRLF